MRRPEAELVRDLTERLLHCFPTDAPTLRKVGREAEYPVVHPDGTAADAQGLLLRLAADTGRPLKHEGDLVVGVLGEVDVLLEVGRGTIELVSPACDDLHQLRACHELAMRQVVAAADSEDLVVLGLGMQPLSGPEAALMAPKDRYRVLLETMGDCWLGFATTASDQVHVDLARDELVPFTNVLNLLTPAILALCANSPVASGEVGARCGREVALAGVFPEHNRFGMLTGPIDRPADWVRRIAAMPYFMEQVPDGTARYDRPFLDWCAERAGGERAMAWNAFQHHERYVWNHARPRGAIGTLEVRPACQQPWREHDAAAALGLGLVCAAPDLATLLHDRLGDGLWAEMHAWRERATRSGLAAEEPSRGLLADILAQCTTALTRRGRGEERLLDPLRRRLADRTEPAADARRVFLEGGAEALVAFAAVRPEAP